MKWVPYDWEALYTSARVDLRLSDREFWTASLRKLAFMLAANQRQTVDRMKVLAHLIRGGSLEGDAPPGVPWDYDPFEGVTL